jgi:WD40 repeat protein
MTYPVTLWDTGTGQRVNVYDGHTMPVWWVAISPDGKYLATATGNYLSKTAVGEVKLWDVATGAELHAGKHAACAWCVAFSPDGKYLASAAGTYTNQQRTTPGEVKLWDVATGREVLLMSEHKGTVFGVAFSPDGRRLASCSADGEIRVVNVLARIGRTIAARPALRERS